MIHMQFALICPAVFEEKIFANNGHIPIYRQGQG